MNDRQRELAKLVTKDLNLKYEIQHVEELLDTYESLHQLRARYGEGALFRADVPVSVVEKFLNNDWTKALETYKSLIKEQYIVKRRLFELTQGKFY